MSKHKPKPKPVEYTLRHFAIAAVRNQTLAREMIQIDRDWLTRKSSGVGETALADVVIENYLDAARFLIEQGADVNDADYSDRTPLSYASSLGYLEMVELLLQHGAEVNTLDDLDQTALRYAAQHGHAEVCDVLLNAGADINLTREFNPSIFEIVHSRKYAKVLEVFEKHGHKEPEPNISQ